MKCSCAKLELFACWNAEIPSTLMDEVYGFSGSMALASTPRCGHDRWGPDLGILVPSTLKPLDPNRVYPPPTSKVFEHIHLLGSRAVAVDPGLAARRQRRSDPTNLKK